MIAPAAAGITPEIASSSVVFPAPFGPSRTVTPPGATSMSTPRTIGNPPRSTRSPRSSSIGETRLLRAQVGVDDGGVGEHLLRVPRAMTRPKSSTVIAEHAVLTSSMSWSMSSTEQPNRSGISSIRAPSRSDSSVASPAPGSSRSRIAWPGGEARRDLDDASRADLDVGERAPGRRPVQERHEAGHLPAPQTAVRRQLDVALHREGRDGETLLERAPDAGPRPPGGGEAVDPRVAEEDLALVARDEPGDRVDERRLARAVGADERVDRARARPRGRRRRAP